MFIFEQNFHKKCSIADPSMMTFRLLFEAKAVLFVKIAYFSKKVEMSLNFLSYYLRQGFFDIFRHFKKCQKL